MEDVGKFQDELSQLVKRAEKDWHLTNSSLAYVLLQKGMGYYFKSLLYEEKHETKM